MTIECRVAMHGIVHTYRGVLPVCERVTRSDIVV
jgi:hypothetical protein